MVKPIKIVVDARMYGLEHAGIGRYVLNLVREIAEDTSEAPNKFLNSQLRIQDKVVLADSEFRTVKETTASSTSEVARRDSSEVEGKEKRIEFCLLVREKKLNEIKKEIGDGFKLVVTETPHYSFKEQIILPIQLFKLKPNLVHFPHFNVPVFWWGKQVVTIHDLIKHESRGTETTTRWRPFYWFKYLNYRFLVWLTVKRAAKIIVPSKWWRKELIRRYELPKNKVVVTYEGVSEKFNLPAKSSKLKAKILNKYGIKKPFVIYTGALYPHKNVGRLVQATQNLNNIYHLSLSLIIACSRNVFYERFRKKIKQMKAERFVNLVGFVPDEELVVLYRQAEAFVFPSLWEGFGLPGLEAMACGCPVVSSNSSCLPEVYGNAALYFDPLDVEDMAEKILKVTRNTSTRNTLIEKGYQQVKKYSWQKMARETLEVYKEALYV